MSAEVASVESLEGELSEILPTNVIRMKGSRVARYGVKMRYRGLCLRIGSQYCDAKSADTVAATFRECAVVDKESKLSFNKTKLDKYTFSIMPQLSEKLVKGDNELLSFIADEFEKKGYQIVGASQIIPNITLDEGFICGSSYDTLSRDIKKADNILKLLSSEDIGQGVVIENGLVLGIETLQGTNELLKFVARTPLHLRASSLGGIFVKRPKSDQDLRFDMPVIGSETISLACQAGLRGLVVSPSSVIILERSQCIEIAEANDFFILAREPVS